MVLPLKRKDLQDIQDGSHKSRNLLYGTNYSYCRTRMKLFIQANDYKVWRILTNGPSIPIKRVESVIIPKEESE
ncbi:hypothetical protein J1N35_022732 [Gossypium stocksii]|uniref:Uncharacterized protein n=1 Tax=Gossypium stocksii TaxID=47602 RepID=A0A9D4A1F1_9ROSI|nr:hypothetical protein J1N35_022732 [Gossypium stocksii]